MVAQLFRSFACRNLRQTFVSLDSVRLRVVLSAKIKEENRLNFKEKRNET